MKKTKKLIIFLITFVVTALNLISINISNKTFINHNIQNQQILSNDRKKEGSHVLLHVDKLRQTSRHEAKAKLTITDDNASKDELLGLYVYSKFDDYDKFINKKMDVKEGISEFGLKNVVIDGLGDGKQDILFTAKYKDNDLDQIEYVSNRDQHLSINIKDLNFYNKKSLAIVITAVIIPWLLTGGLIVFLYLRSRKNQDKITE